MNFRRIIQEDMKPRLLSRYWATGSTVLCVDEAGYANDAFIYIDKSLPNKITYSVQMFYS